jgi:hypothetical protein
VLATELGVNDGVGTAFAVTALGVEEEDGRST